MGEEYAVRLLKVHHPDSEARKIARALVEDYPEHNFPIDREEARSLRLRVDDPTDEMDELLEQLWQAVQDETVLGAFQERKS